MPEAKSTIIVDLDGTLIKTDCLYESFLLLIKKNPFYIFLVILWLFQGKAKLKYEIAKRVDLNVSLLPLNEKVIQFIKRFDGKKILATASNEKYAQAIAKNLNIFDDVLASSESFNLLGTNKAKVIQERYGNNYIYLGDSRHDIPLWQASNHAYVVNPSSSLIHKIKSKVQNIEIIQDEAPSKSKSFKALRPHQWAKNILLFAPLLAAHRYNEIDLLISTLIAFISFSLCASSVYILNDLTDLEDDRAHARKRNRPFASGALSLKYGIRLIPILLAISISIALQLGTAFLATLAIYYCITLAYSLFLKRIAIADTVTLSALYIIRMIAGAAVAAIPLSFWFLAFGIFLFYSLAVLKRYIEVVNSQATISNRGYLQADEKLLPIFGISSSYISILILMLYLHHISPMNIVEHPLLMLGLCFILLFWYTRLWSLAQRDQLHDDPVIFVLKDPTSIVLGLISLIFLYCLA